MLLKCRPVAEADLATVCAFPRNEVELFHLFPSASFPLSPEQLRAAIAQRLDKEGGRVALIHFRRELSAP